jgi:hypothetical protein
MDKMGNGVAYVSPEDCIIVGIGGLSARGVPGSAPPSSPLFLKRDAKLGRRWLKLPNERRPMKLRTRFCSGVSGLSSIAESSGPNERRGGMKREL